MRACPFCGFVEGWTYPYPRDEKPFLPDDAEANFRVVCKVCGAEGPPAVTTEMAEKKWDGLLKNIKNDNKFKQALSENNNRKWQQQSEELVTPLKKQLALESKDAQDVDQKEACLNEARLRRNNRMQNIDSKSILNDLEDWLELQNIHDEDEELEEIESWLEINYVDDPNYDLIRDIVSRKYDIYLGEEAMGGVSGPMSTLNNTPGMGNATPGKTAAMTGSQQNSPDAKGSGDKFDASIGKTNVQEGLNEQNINPYDKIGVMMAKSMGIELPFEKGDGDQDVKQKTKFKQGSHRIMDYADFANKYDSKKNKSNGIF